MILAGLAIAIGAACAGPLRGPEEAGDGGGQGSGGHGDGGSLFQPFPPSDASTAAGKPPPPDFGPDEIISISPDSAYETDSSIAWSLAPDVVAVAWKAVTPAEGSFIGYAFSLDGGHTFLPPSSLGAPGGRSSGDPSLMADQDGNIYLAWLGFMPKAGGGVTDTHVYVAKALAGQADFGPPVEVSDPADVSTYATPRIVLTVDVHPLVTYAYAGPGGQGLLAARTADGGATWSRSTIVADPSSTVAYDLPSPATDQWNGAVYVAHLERIAGTVSAHLRWSKDNGETWAPTDTTEVSQPGEPVALTSPSCIFSAIFRPAPAPSTFFVYMSYGLSHDPVDAGTAQKLFDIRFAASNDAGKSFPSNASMLDQSAGLFALSPQLVGGQTGAMNLLYYAGKSAGDEAGSFRWARDPAWYGSLLAPAIVKQPIAYQNNRADLRSVGETRGASGGKDRFFTTYVDNASGASHIAIHREGIAD